MESSPPSSLAALRASLEHLDDEQLQVLIGQAQGILLDRVAAEQVPPLSVEIVDREEECILRAYRSLAPPMRSRALRLSAAWASRSMERSGIVAASTTTQHF